MSGYWGAEGLWTVQTMWEAEHENLDSRGVLCLHVPVYQPLPSVSSSAWSFTDFRPGVESGTPHGIGAFKAPGPLFNEALQPSSASLA